jgi:PAS domain S-box-containing protein
MRILHNVPIKRKVLTVTLLVAAVGLLLTGGALFGFQVYSFQKNFPRELAADGSIIASHSVGPLALKDPAAATEMMGALKAKPHISEAQLRLPDGSLFARNGNDPIWIPVPGRGLRHDGPYLVYSEPLFLDRERIGILHLRADYRAELFALLRVHALVLGVVLAVSIVLTALLSARLQRVISEPILSLAATAKAIATKKDFSVRARKLENDEIGQFTEAFNEMLAEIQNRDTALHRSRKKLETLINTIEGVVWEADPATLRFSFVSAQSERLLGLSATEWTNGDQFLKQYVHPDYREQVVAELRHAVEDRKPCVQEYRLRIPGRDALWVRSYTNIIIDEDEPILLRGVLVDVTREKKAAEEMAMHAEQLQTSRHAGMAEVATGVLHNVGNVLNSVNVSATIVCERIRKSEVTALPQLSTLLRQNEKDFAHFFTRDAKGRLVPDFVHQLAKRLQEEQAETLRELELLAKNIEHIKEIVAMQQSYARVAGSLKRCHRLNSSRMLCRSTPQVSSATRSRL